MKDMKGLKVGVSARGTSSEWLFNTMLADGGLKPSDVTYVAVGGPATAYTALVIGKQVDLVVMFQPLTQLCRFNKTCDTVVDLTQGEGPAKIKAQNGASVVFAMRGEMVKTNPQVVASLQAAFRDAAVWFNDPANFEELVKIFTPLISFGDLAGADQLRREWIKSVLFAYSKDLAVSRPALKAVIDYNTEAGLIDKPVTVEQMVTSATP
jgi:NitT/TauT family transport system substrate-binding protein